MSEEVKEEVPVEPQGSETPAETPAEETKTEEPKETPAENTDVPADEPKEEAPQEEQGDNEEPEGEESGYVKSDDPALNQVVTMLEGADVPLDVAEQIFAEAAESGDPSQINMDALIEAVGQEKADVIMLLANTAADKMKAMKSELFDMVGGQETFDGMREWALEKENADPEFAKDLAELRDMLDSKKPRQMRAAVQELFDMYAADPETTVSADLVKGDSAGRKSTVSPLTRAEFGRLSMEANEKGTYEKEKASLWARRQAGIKQGI